MKYKYYKNKSLKEISAVRIGGVAHDYYEIFDEEALQAVIAMCHVSHRFYYIIGNATKLLFPDGEIDVVIIRMRLLNLTQQNDVITVGSGYSLIRLAHQLAKEGYQGFSGLSGIPASLGGAVVNNAGAFGDEISTYITSIRVLDDGQIKSIPREQVVFGYRYSSFKIQSSIILSVTFQLERSAEDEVEKVRQYEIRRKLTQPYDALTLGSTFQNPPAMSIGEIVEKAQLKGLVSGAARISEKHGNFIENMGSATQKNVLYLIDIIVATIYNKFRIIPKLEMIILRW